MRDYVKRKRMYGEGEVRIESTITLSEDIYSIGFISQMRDDIMVKFLDISTGNLREDKKDEPKTPTSTKAQQKQSRFGL